MASPVELDQPVINLVTRITPRTLILDAGCGLGKWTWLLTCFLRAENPTVIALDLYETYLKSIKRWHRDDVILASIQELPFRPNSFDATIISEVIEHLPKVQGERCLAQILRVSREVVLTTPRTYADVLPLDNNLLNLHKSEWTTSELRSFGFKVYRTKHNLVATTLWPLPFAVSLRRMLFPQGVRGVLKRALNIQGYAAARREPPTQPSSSR